MRKYCIDCCKKHLGSAAVLEDEVFHGYPQYELYVLGHLDQAASEIQGLHMGLANVIREHRIRWLEDHTWNIPYELLWRVLDTMTLLSESEARNVEINVDSSTGFTDAAVISEDTRRSLGKSEETSGNSKNPTPDVGGLDY